MPARDAKTHLLGVANARHSLGYSTPAVPITVTGVTVPVPPATGTGLTAHYFGTNNLSGAARAQRTETPNFDWGTGSAGNGLPADNFSVRWQGQIEAPVTGTWPANEWLVRAYGSTHPTDGVAQISFVTNTGRALGPYGRAKDSGRTSFNITVPANNRVLGFAGRNGEHLTTIRCNSCPASPAAWLPRCSNTKTPSSSADVR